MQTQTGKTTFIVAVSVMMLSMSGAAGQQIDAVNAAEGRSGQKWVGTWATSPHQPDLGVPGLANTGFNNQTVRQIVHISVGGRQVRVRLSAFGSNGLVIGAAHIALRSSGAAIDPASDRSLTFGGKPGITIPPGALVVSDPVSMNIPAFSDLAISVFTPGNSGPATWHFEARQLSYISLTGDFTGASDIPGATSVPAWFWLAGVDVAAAGRGGAVAAFGESVTDGSQSTVGANHRWPDYLAQRLTDERGAHSVGVLNQGIAGSSMLHDSLGPNALARFDRDVLSQTGVTHLIVQMGQNDIFTVNPADEVTADQVIQAHRQLIERAHAKGLRIFGCTITPNEGFLLPGTPIPVFTAAKEIKRQAVNAWIRTGGEYDAVIDFDRVLRDPQSPTRILPSLDSGDHGHPTDAGYKMLAEAVSLDLFKQAGDDH